MPTTAPAISTKTRTRVIPFLRSEFSPKKWPALKRKPTKKMIPSIIGNIFLIVSEISATESSIPPICAKSEVESNDKKVARKIDFFITKNFKFLIRFRYEKIRNLMT